MKICNYSAYPFSERLRIMEMKMNTEFLDEIKLTICRSVPNEFVFFFVQGSQNYNLDYDKSDIDVKAFVIPTLDDLYFSNRVSKTIATPYGQASIHDIRMLPGLLSKMNPTYIEFFFACEFVFASKDKESKIKQAMPTLFSLHDSFNKLYADKKNTFLSAILGTILKKADEAYHPTEIRKPVIEKYGYDIKSVSHAFRLKYLYDFVSENDGDVYENFLSVLRNENPSVKDELMKIKLGEIPLQKIQGPLANLSAWAQAELKLHNNAKVESETIHKIEDEIHDSVLKALKYDGRI